MPTNEPTTSSHSPTREALAKIRELKQKLAEAEGPQNEPIAIVSTACRFPRHSDSPEAFWQSLLDGTDVVGEVPSDRWDLDAYFDEDPDTPAKMYARKGTFLDNIDGMDADFFGISPREATWIDPQQRLFLEVSWEALERAGWTTEKSGKDTGVFVGWMHNDYQNEASESLLDLNPYIATGSAGSFLCGRLSYYLGIQGPSLAVDTACSSSLVALHLACQSLRQGECDRALAGGVNIMVSPKTTIMTCKLHALSPSGHSRAFDASADGYLRGEGCGVVTLRRLSDALRDGDSVLAVISGSAITHNGFSSGLTAPNPDSQQRVIRRALELAGIAPSEVSYLEAHGTGTELGDPIEMHAAAAVLGEGREAGNPLRVGSVKTNLGHLEAAAGIAGLIKTVLSIQHGKIPRHLHFETPNPHIAWDRLPVQVVTQNMDWPAKNGRRIAGVSAFGMSGTNAHVVIESPPETSGAASAKRDESFSADRRHLIVLSGKSEGAVQALAGKYHDWLPAHAGEFSDVCYSAATTRRHFEHRAAIVSNSPVKASETLARLAAGTESPNLFLAQARPHSLVAWQFTGQGSQYEGMGRRLYEAEPVFRRAMDDCAARLAEMREGNLIDIIFSDGKSLGDTYWTQPALFSIHISLAELLWSWGLKPDAVLGHSVGQYAAACVAGMLDWQEGMRLIHERARLTGSLPAGGAMAAVFADEATITEAIAPHPSLSIAAHNGSHIAISGPEQDVDAVMERLAAEGVRAKKLHTSHAFHSVLLDPILDEFEQVASSISFRPAEVPLICNVSGEALAADRILDGPYWRSQLREGVQFAKSIRSLASLGCEAVLELGPLPILTGMAAACWSKNPSALIPTLQKDRDDADSMMESVARLYCHGVNPDFELLLNPEGDRHRIGLPTYPFQRKRHWGPEKPGAMRVRSSTLHPLLGEERALAGVQNETRYENWISPDRPQWLGDHRVFEDIVFPGAGYVEMSLAAAKGARVLENLSFEMPLMVSKPACLQTVVQGSGDTGSIEIYSSAGPGSPWTRHVTASYLSEAGDAPRSVSIAEIEALCPATADPASFYEMMGGLGLHYGAEFQTIRSLRFGDADVLARIELAGDHRGYHLPPMLLDGAFQSLAVGLFRNPNSPLFLPVGIERFHRLGPVTGDLWCHGVWHETEGDIRTANLTIFDDHGSVVAFLENLKVRAVNRSALLQMVGSSSERLLYHVTWRQAPFSGMHETPGWWLVVGEEEQWTAEAATILGNARQKCVQVCLKREGEGPAEPEFEDDRATIEATNFDHWIVLLARYFPGTDPGRLNGVAWSAGVAESDCANEESASYTKLHCAGLLGLLQALRAHRIEWLDRGLQVLTRNAVVVNRDDSISPDASQLWGLGRVIGNEYPPLRCRLIDLDAGNSSLADLADILLTESRESQLALRSGIVYVPRLVALRAPGGENGLPVVDDGTYLITGGLGMLGRRAAEWLASKGARDIVLVSRREPDDSTREVIAGIEEAGCKIHVLLADMGRRESVAGLLEQIKQDLPPLKGIIHAAGVLKDGLLVEQTWEGFERVLAPKRNGAWLLHELTLDLPLDFFVLYSSAASVLGSPGQANYATANAFLDGLAHFRAASGRPGLSVNFGPWNEGMAATETVTKAVALQGMTPLTADEAHEAMDRLIDNASVQATMLDVDWGRMRMRFPGDAPSLLEELWPDSVGDGSAGAVLLEKLKEAEESGTSRETVVANHVRAQLQQVLSLPEPPEPDVPLAELGLDSLMAVELATRLQQQVGSAYAIPPTLAFDYPSVAQLTKHLLGLIEANPVKEEAVKTLVTRDDDCVAVVGIGCRFPGADGPKAYWKLLREGIDATRELPEGRWDLEQFYSPEPKPGKMYTKRGGFLPDVDRFDAAFFGLSDEDANWMDPQHRMLLEVSWQALEDAGMVPGKMPSEEVGVFMGIMGFDYAQLRERLDPDTLEASHGAGLSHSAGVGRISYLFGFEGPSIAVDTASSSSLVAVCQAARSLMEGECSIALAGGANAILSPTNSILLSKGGVLSPDGRSKSFSAKADGFGRGEGCGVVVLKRRSDAERDGDRILALIGGTAIGHNGHNGGLTAPSGRSQQAMIRRALESAGLAPSEVQYLEAHGTGTELGDPIEIRAASEVLGQGREDGNELLVGSAKANISHLEAAGGISGFIKVVLSMKHGIIPRQIHFDEPSPHIPWDKIRVRVVVEETSWPNPDRPVAAVSALGMTGTNAHVILEGAPRQASPPPSETPFVRSRQLLVFSAKSKAAQKSLAQRYAELLSQTPEEEFAALCHSAATGRRHHEHRTAIVARSAREAAEIIEDGGKVLTGAKQGSAKLAWEFPGEGAEFAGMGKALYGDEPVFKEVLDDCDRLLSAEGHASILKAMFEDETGLETPSIGVPALFAVEMALARLWRGWGIEPDMVLGQGVGQYAAACAAGMMNWNDGLRLAAKRGDILTLGGEIPESALEEFETLADSFDCRPCDRPLICSITGSALPVHKVPGGSYWRRHLVESRGETCGHKAIGEAGCDKILVVGPGCINADGSPDEVEVLCSLTEGVDESQTMFESLGKLYVAGWNPDFDGFDESWHYRKVQLPEYPFQRKRYWLTNLDQFSSCDPAGLEEELILSE